MFSVKVPTSDVFWTLLAVDALACETRKKKFNCQEYEKKEKISELNFWLKRKSSFCFIRGGGGVFNYDKKSNVNSLLHLQS